MNDLPWLLDSNVWIALTFSSHPGHRAASESMAQLTNNRPAVFCRATQQSFLRLVTTSALTWHYGAAAVTNDEAIELLDRFMASPLVTFQEEPAGLYPIWRQLAGCLTAAPRIWMDAYLAAFAIVGGLTIVTLDQGFASFEPAGLDLVILQSP